MEQQTNQPDASKIMQVGMGFWASKVMLTAVKFDLFTFLAGTSKSGNEIKDKLNFKTTDRHVYDWLDTLVSLGFLQREGLLENAKYSNSADAEIFLDKNKPSYIGGILVMANNRLYNHWSHLEEGLLTGESQNESRGSSGMDFFEELYKSPEKLSEFINAMSGIQVGNFMQLVNKFNFGKYKTMTDVGGADGFLSCLVAQKYPGMTFTTFDLPPVAPLADQKIKSFNVSDRVKFQGGDFFEVPIPAAEVITMGNILHGMNEESKIATIQRVYDALPESGLFIVIENIIDPERNKNTFGLLMSLNMLIENGDAFDFTLNDFDKWVKQVGFSRTEIIPLAGPTSAAIAYKS